MSQATRFPFLSSIIAPRVSSIVPDCTLAALLVILLPADGWAQSRSLPGAHSHSQSAVEGGTSETGMDAPALFSHVGPGADFVQTSIMTRRLVTHLDQPGQLEPFMLAIPDLPAGAELVKVIVSWNWLIDGAPPGFDSITIDNAIISGMFCGSGQPDLCWRKAGGVSYVALLDDIPHGQVVTVSGATCKPLGIDNLAYGEGLTILCVYSVAGEPDRNVDVYCGYASTESNPVVVNTAMVDMLFSNSYVGGDFHFFLNALDGQAVFLPEPNFCDDFYINGVLVSGQVAGTGIVSNAWQGFLGPNGLNDLYDAADDDLLPLGVIPVPSPSLRATTFLPNASDCVGHSFGAVAFPIDAPTWESWSPGSPCSSGVIPDIICIGPLVPGSQNELNVANGPPVTKTYLIGGFGSSRLPFAGGILGPTVDAIKIFFTDAVGTVSLQFVWPAIPAGTQIWMQYWFEDPAVVPWGLCSTETLRGTGQ